tara:strand:+ start:593 stop:1090 length:498 start_codon:yes stop_codon:yes gene_type:complete
MAKVYFAEIHWTTKEVMNWFTLGGDTVINDTTLEADPTSSAAEEYVNSLWKRGNIYKAFSKTGDYTGWAIDRKNSTGIDSTWDETNDVFIFPKPFPSYTLDADYKWQPPVAFPSITTYTVDGVEKDYAISWYEDGLTWRGLKDTADWNNQIFEWNTATSQWEIIV